LKGIGIYEFSNNDIIRNPLITKILERYDKWK
jgi:phosphate starvation-inducible protein PhoH